MSSSLESRYRRLLALYPAAHRDVYEEEMLGVLLDGAREGQHRPGLREAADLISSALRTWVGSTAAGLTDDRWQRASGALGLLIPLFLMLDRLQAAASGPIGWSGPDGMAGFSGGGMTVWNAIALTLAAGWAVTIALALLGRWRVAAAVATLTFGGQTAVLGSVYLRSPVVVVLSLWTVALGAIAVGCLWSARGSTRGLPVRRRSMAVLAIATLGVFALPLLDPSGGPVVQDESGGYFTVDADIALTGFHLPGPIDYLRGPALLALLVIAVMAVAGLLLFEKGIRRRVVALLAPVAALAVLIDTSMQGFMTSSVRFDPPVLLAAGEWIALVGVPFATFAAATVVVHRRDRALELIELGRSARRAEALR